MKNKISIYIFFFASILLFGCEDLDYNEKSYLNKDDVYSNVKRVKAALSGIYTYIPSGFRQIDDAMLASACDEAVFAVDNSNVHNFFNGAWTPSRTLDSKWNLYEGIRNVNLFLQEVEKHKFLGHKYDTKVTYEELMKEIKRFKFEAKGLRAYFYLELVKRYGSIPLTNTILTKKEANNLPSSSFEEVIKFIVDECDIVAKELPVTYENIRGKEYGRLTKGAALAIKAQALLYLASPLNNESNDVNKWIDAAKAAKDIINIKNYSLYKQYKAIFTEYKSKNKEVIFSRREGNSNKFERINFPVGYVGGNSGNCPTQNLVDCYEMKDTGLPISDPASGYDPNNPYSGRDPRFKLSILCNGSIWKKKEIQVWNGGLNGAPLKYASPTGYYLKKYVIESTTLKQPNVNSKVHNWVIFRLGGVLLDYAEAMNEAYGPENDGGLGLTALQAVNRVRERAKMPKFPSGMSKDEFRNKLRNERRVELAFEGHRFWDLRRWKAMPASQEIFGMKVTNNNDGSFSYEKFVYKTRTFEEKMYRYPIPYKETIINSNIKQNTGW